MTVIALILLAVVIFMVVAAVTGSADAVTIDVFDVSIDTTVTEVFLAGVVTGLIALAGLVLLRIALRHSRLRRQEMRELRRRAEHARATGDTAAHQDATADGPVVDDDRDVDTAGRYRAEPETTPTDAVERPPESRRE